MSAAPPVRALRVAFAAVCAVTRASPASAHHDSNPNRSAAGIVGVAATPQTAESAVGLSSTVQTLSGDDERGTTAQAELFGQVALTETLSAGLLVPVLYQLPLGQAAELGLGALGAELKWAYRKQATATRGVLFAQVRFPTQTAYLWNDPGSVWNATLGGAHSFFAGIASLQLAAWLTGDQRPAGQALDAGLGILTGTTLGSQWFLGVGAEARSRIVTRCALPGGHGEWCNDGRAGEVFGANGATEVTLSGRTEWSPAPAQRLGFAVGAPLTHVRSVDFFAELAWTHLL